MENLRGKAVDIEPNSNVKALIIEKDASMSKLLKFHAEKVGIKTQNAWTFLDAIKILKEEKNNGNLMDLVFVSGSNSDYKAQGDLEIIEIIKKEKLSRLVTLFTYNHTHLYSLKPEELKEKGIDILVNKTDGMRAVQESFVQAKSAIKQSLLIK